MLIVFAMHSFDCVTLEKEIMGYYWGRLKINAKA